MRQAVKDKLNALLTFLRAQMAETSTIRGFVSFLGVAGLLKGYSVDTVLPLVLFAFGVLQVLLPDKIK